MTGPVEGGEFSWTLGGKELQTAGRWGPLKMMSYILNCCNFGFNVVVEWVVAVQ